MVIQEKCTMRDANELRRLEQLVNKLDQARQLIKRTKLKSNFRLV